MAARRQSDDITVEIEPPKAGASAPAAPQRLEVTMEAEKLGIKFQRDAQGAVVRGLTAGGAAESLGVAIPVGTRLAAVNGASMSGRNYDDVLAAIKAASRPVTLAFETAAGRAASDESKAQRDLAKLREVLPPSEGPAGVAGGLADMVSPTRRQTVAKVDGFPEQGGAAEGLAAPLPRQKVELEDFEPEVVTQARGGIPRRRELVQEAKLVPAKEPSPQAAGWGSWFFGGGRKQDAAPAGDPGHGAASGPAGLPGEPLGELYVSGSSRDPTPRARPASGTLSPGQRAHLRTLDSPKDSDDLHDARGAQDGHGPMASSEDDEDYSDDDYSEYSDSDYSDAEAVNMSEKDQDADRPRWVYLLKPSRAEMLVEGPNRREGHHLDQHYQYVRRMARKGVVEFAGATLNADGSAFGLVMFAADGEDAALRFLSRDPAVRSGVLMTKLFPFQVTIQTADPDASGHEPVPAVPPAIAGALAGPSAAGRMTGAGVKGRDGIEIQTAPGSRVALQGAGGAAGAASEQYAGSTAAILQHQLDEALSRLDDATEKVTYLGVDNANLERRLSELEDQLQDALSRVETAEAVGAERATQTLKQELKKEAQGEMKEAINALRSMLMASKVEVSDLQAENRELREYIDSGQAAAVQLSMGDGSAGGNAQFLKQRVLEAQGLRRAAEEARQSLLEDAKMVFNLLSDHGNAAAELEKEANAHYKLLAGVLSGEERRLKDLPKSVATVTETVSKPSALALSHEELLGGKKPSMTGVANPLDQGSNFFYDEAASAGTEQMRVEGVAAQIPGAVKKTQGAPPPL